MAKVNDVCPDGNERASPFGRSVFVHVFKLQHIDGAVEVPLADRSVSLSWAGGDPDAGNTVAYDIYFGTATDSLIKIGDSISKTTYEKDNLAQAITYFWQVIANVMPFLHSFNSSLGFL